MCGEYISTSHFQWAFMGSPPHTWRIPQLISNWISSKGITSTYVENTYMDPAGTITRRDHLHIRGEYQEIGLCFLHNPGSPPHTWRIQYGGNTIDNINGITSTYVENTGSSSAYVRLYEDHLHIRGEYRLIWQSVMLRIGSPPHTWRIRYFQASLWRSFRITSTYVENTKMTEKQFKEH